MTSSHCEFREPITRWLASYVSAAKLLQSCLTLCDPIDGSPPGFPVPGILQARTLERVAISFSNAWKWKVKVKLLSHVWLFTTPWTAAYQAPPSKGFSRQEYWSGVPLPSQSYVSRIQKYNSAFIISRANISSNLKKKTPYFSTFGHFHLLQKIFYS